uniref:SKA complex subunit 1 n=1 Tax=Oryzias latipes TaxID=8090 RepID=A0A3P9KB37_ORYLA
MSGLEDISRHFHDKIWSLQQMLDLWVVELPQIKMKKFGQELCGLERLLEEFEKCVDEQKQQLQKLKDMQAVYQQALQDVQHMKDHMPPHIPRMKSALSGKEAGVKPKEGVDIQPAPAGNPKKTSRNFTKEMGFITTLEFESIPQYMRGRVSYEQLNAAVSSMNAAATAKYKILHQPVKGLSNHARKLHQRFKDQENKETKGQFFVVEEDIREFTQMKVDKRFQGILNMLRHCQRLRELRGGGLTRYLFL